MKVVSEKSLHKRKGFVVTIGVFDGVHLGHRFVIQKANRAAQKAGVSSLVITFSPHPSLFLKKRFPGYITARNDKKKIFGGMGVDYYWEIPLTSELMKLQGKEFIRRITDKIKINMLVVGDDFKFGHKGACSVRDLKNMSGEFGFKVMSVKRKKIGGRIVSSSLIREDIENGNFHKIKFFLGREYILTAPIKKGKGIGRHLGFPTFNLDFGERIIPRGGVYAVKALIGKTALLGVCDIGTGPTFNRGNKNRSVSLEIHVINYQGGKIKNIGCLFLERLRDEKKFSSIERLKKTIQKDIDYTLTKYSANPPFSPQLVV